MTDIHRLKLLFPVNLYITVHLGNRGDWLHFLYSY